MEENKGKKTPKRGVKGRIKFMLNESPMAKSAKGFADYLGLTYDGPSSQPQAPVKQGKPCGEAGCDITNVHRHIYDEEEPLSPPPSSHPVQRADHFNQGSTEHLPEGVVSLNAYRQSKAQKKPGGY